MSYPDAPLESSAPAAPPTTATVKKSVGRGTVLIALLVTAVIVGLAAFSIGRLSTLGDARPGTTSAEAGFSRDMQVHHDQGVELSLIIRDRTADEPTRLLAYDITRTQGQQSGQMYAWLVLWGLPQASLEPSMTWMTRAGSGDSHDHGADHVAGEPMPGLATSEQITELQSLSGVAAEREFLTLMIAHHQGAIDMADALLARSDNSTVRTFADAVVQSQESEIGLMTRMLAERS
ncbi:MAG: DUF305 domain-containing protein [Cryobacterium sp.]